MEVLGFPLSAPMVINQYTLSTPDIISYFFIKRVLDAFDRLLSDRLHQHSVVRINKTKSDFLSFSNALWCQSDRPLTGTGSLLYTAPGIKSAFSNALTDRLLLCAMPVSISARVGSHNFSLSGIRYFPSSCLNVPSAFFSLSMTSTRYQFTAIDSPCE